MSAVGVLAAILVTVCVVPQVVAVLRSSEIGGVSVTGASFAAVSCGGWTLYAVRAGLVEVAWSSAIGAALWLTIAVAVGSRDHRRPSPWSAAWLAVILGATVALGMLDIPDGVSQAELIPVAYFRGEDFLPGTRRPLDEIAFHDRWGARPPVRSSRGGVAGTLTEDGVAAWLAERLT